MDSLLTSHDRIKNLDSPFTEILSILVKYKQKTNGSLTLAYDRAELSIMSAHIDNVSTILLSGLQDLGRVVSAMLHKHTVFGNEINDLGYLFSTVLNLVEALQTLRSDADFAMQQFNDCVRCSSQARRIS